MQISEWLPLNSDASSNVEWMTVYGDYIFSIYMWSANSYSVYIQLKTPASLYGIDQDYGYSSLDAAKQYFNDFVFSIESKQAGNFLKDEPDENSLGKYSTTELTMELIRRGSLL